MSSEPTAAIQGDEHAPAQPERILRRLRAVRWLAALDLILFIALLIAAATGRRNAVHVLGPLHGINFLILLVTVATGALDRLWSWWYPAAVLLTAGPIGAFVGEWMIGRRVADAGAWR